MKYGLTNVYSIGACLLGCANNALIFVLNNEPFWLTNLSCVMLWKFKSKFILLYLFILLFLKLFSKFAAVFNIYFSKSFSFCTFYNLGMKRDLNPWLPPITHSLIFKNIFILVLIVIVKNQCIFGNGANENKTFRFTTEEFCIFLFECLFYILPSDFHTLHSQIFA